MFIVTGMHRSGTSFCAQALSRLGADFGDADILYPADKWNESGYFESIPVIDVNNRAILGANAKIEHWLNAPETPIRRLWNSVESGKWKYFLFPKEAGIQKRALRYEAEIMRLHEVYRGAYVKDPRFCLTLSTWQRFGSVEGIVFSFRNPVAVAGSIKRREKLPIWFGERYWYYHVRAFFTQLDPETPLYLMNFDHVFHEDMQATEFENLCRFMGRDSTEAGDLSSVLDVRLRTQKQAGVSRNPAISRAYDGLLGLHTACAGGNPICLKDYEPVREAIING